MPKFCQKCGRPIKTNDLAYKLKIDLTSLPEEQLSLPDEDIDRYLERIIKEVERRAPNDLEKDVFQTINLTICRPCRNRLVMEWDLNTAQKRKLKP